MCRFDGAVPCFGFSTMPVISDTFAVRSFTPTMPYWCVSFSGTGDTAMWLPPCSLNASIISARNGFSP